MALVTAYNARQGRLLCQCPDGTVHGLCSEEGCVGAPSQKAEVAKVREDHGGRGQVGETLS